MSIEYRAQGCLTSPTFLSFKTNLYINTIFVNLTLTLILIESEPGKLSAPTADPLHRRNPAAVRHRCAQRCDSKNKHSAVTVKTSTAL